MQDCFTRCYLLANTGIVIILPMHMSNMHQEFEICLDLKPTVMLLNIFTLI